MSTKIIKKTDFKTVKILNQLFLSVFEGIPASVYGAPGGGGYYPSTGWSGSNYNTGLGYNGYSGYSGYTSPEYLGYGGSTGYSGLTGIGYNSLGGGHNQGYPYSTFSSGGYLGNGGYGGYGGNGGLLSYSGYNNPYYNTQNNLGYGYYKGGVGSGYYNKGYGLTGYGGITPGYITGYRGYTKWINNPFCYLNIWIC